MLKMKYLFILSVDIGSTSRCIAWWICVTSLCIYIYHVNINICKQKHQTDISLLKDNDIQFLIHLVQLQDQRFVLPKCVRKFPDLFFVGNWSGALKVWISNISEPRIRVFLNLVYFLTHVTALHTASWK